MKKKRKKNQNPKGEIRREKEGRDESLSVWLAEKGSGVWGERRKKMERKNKIKSMGPCVSLGGEKRVEE